MSLALQCLLTLAQLSFNVLVHLKSHPMVAVVKCTSLGLLPFHLDHADPWLPCWDRHHGIMDVMLVHLLFPLLPPR